MQLRGAPPSAKRAHTGQPAGPKAAMKTIFITSFNALKKALTYDLICDKVRPNPNPNPNPNPSPNHS